METTRLPIAVDAMGGDNAPEAIVAGACRATSLLDVDIELVGPIERLTPLVADCPRVHIVDAREVIEMGEHPGTALRAKKDASIVRACRLVADGVACAVVGAGNSGAVLGAALLEIKRLPHVHRPAIGAWLPRRGGGQTFVLDIGANSECKPEWLYQFAQMGAAYVAVATKLESPRVATLSNGEEEGKGTTLTHEVQRLLTDSSLKYVGNIEGKDLFTDACDVAVCDGFTGNIMLKTAEGVGEFLFAAIKDAAMQSTMSKLAAGILKPRLQSIRDTVDYRKTGGALLLGVAGEVVIAHGRSDAEAMTQAIRVARDAAAQNVHGAIVGSMTSGNARVIHDQRTPVEAQ